MNDDDEFDKIESSFTSANNQIPSEMAGPPRKQHTDTIQRIRSLRSSSVMSIKEELRASQSVSVHSMELITFSDFPPYIFDLIMSYTNEDTLMLVCKQVFLNVVNYKIEQFDDQLRFLTRHLQDLTIEL